MLTSRPAYAKRLPGIEGLRGIAAAAVVVTHTWAHAWGGGKSFQGFGPFATYVFPKLAHGVTLFFALSGFLLYLPFATAAIRGEPRPSFGSYLRNRALRIVPAYWVILLLVCLVGAARLQPRGTGWITNPWTITRNLFLVQNYSPHTLATGISPAWSLAVEVVFYLVLPLLVIAGIVCAGRTSTRTRRVFAMLVPPLILGGVGLVGNFWYHLSPSALLNVSFLARAHLFALGMVLAVLRVQWEDRRFRLPQHWRVVVIALMLLVAATTIKLGVDGRILGTFEVAGMSVALSLLLALVVLGRPKRRGLVRFLETRPMVFAGNVSYSVYLWHLPVIFFLVKYGLTVPGPSRAAFLADVVLVAVVTYLLSWTTYTFVEKPALRLKARRRIDPAHDAIAQHAAAST